MRGWIGGVAAFACIAALACAAPAHAQTPDFVPGRPGATESAIATPQGRWQIESELASYTRDDDSDSESWSALATTLRYGVARGWDVEAVVAPFTRVESGGESVEGFGDITLRARRTFAGLEGGPSFGLIGYVTLPTAEDDLGAEEVEGGLIAAGSFDLTDAWELTWTGGLGAVSNGDDYDAQSFGGFAFGRGLGARGGMYFELFAEHLDDETAASFNVGATYLIGPETQIDAGVDFGFTDAADDARVFIGWAHRL